MYYLNWSSKSLSQDRRKLIFLHLVSSYSLDGRTFTSIYHILPQHSIFITNTSVGGFKKTDDHFQISSSLFQNDKINKGKNYSTLDPRFQH